MSGRPRKKFATIPGYTHETEQAKIDGVQLSTKQRERSQGRGQAYIKKIGRFIMTIQIGPGISNH